MGLGGFLLAGSEMYRLVEMLEKSGVTETTILNKCTVFPNPVTNEMNISSEYPIEA